MTFNKTLLTATMLTLGGFAAMSANAAGETKTGTFDVNLAITSICSVTSAKVDQDISFTTSASGVAVAEASSAAPILVKCSNLTPYNVGLLGTGFMTDAVSTNKVAYSLLKTAGGAVWGNTGTDVGGTGTGMGPDEAKPHTVFASLAAGATDNLAVGSYKDAVTVTVTY